LNAINLTSLIEHAIDINIAWQQWKDAFLTAVSHYIPMKKIKGRNPAPWVNGTILNAIRKKGKNLRLLQTIFDYNSN
jgi:hypothetical protein